MSDDWDDWNDFDEESSSSDSLDWGDSFEDSPNTSSTSDNFMNDTSGWDTPIEEVAPSTSNSTFQQEEFVENKQLSAKTVGIIIAVALAVLALVLMGLSNLSFSKKSDVVEQSTEAPNSPTEGVNTQRDSVSLQEVPSDTQIDYSGDITDVNGTIISKKEYLLDGQVLYCLEISVGIQNEQSIHYFCGYNVYDSVSVGDSVLVSYQQVSDTCYSINTISK